MRFGRAVCGVESHGSRKPNDFTPTFRSQMENLIKPLETKCEFGVKLPHSFLKVVDSPGASLSFRSFFSRTNQTALPPPLPASSRRSLLNPPFNLNMIKSNNFLYKQHKNSVFFLFL